jgi:hypothetical protein
MNIKFKVWVKEAFHYEQRPVALYSSEGGFIGRYTEHELTLLGFHIMVSVKKKDVLQVDELIPGRYNIVSPDKGSGIYQIIEPCPPEPKYE